MEILDTYYFDRQRAMEVALQENMIDIIKGRTVPQICYYDGEPFENAPRTLINVPFEKVVDFFTNTSLRLPKYFEWSDNDDMNKGRLMADILSRISKVRVELSKCNLGVLSQSKPEFKNDRPWRIAFPVSILTDVWKHCIRSVAKEFQKLGYEIKIIQEEDDLHFFDYRFFSKAIAEFNPHVIFYISEIPPAYLHPDVYFVSWWQDITPALRNADKINWRPKDLLFSLCVTGDELLIKTGAKNIQRQGVGVDTDVYRVIPGIKRQRKVVYVGVSYSSAYQVLPKCEGDNDILKVIDGLLEAGKPVTRALVESLGRKYNTSPNGIFEKHVAYLIRERTVEWLCQNTDIEVEIYGRHWETNPIVKPFFKGELPFGDAVARVYNEAMYAISAAPLLISLLRFLEMSACGCIPIVYDCRHIAEKPHWDNECLFYRSRDELYSCFDKVPAGNPEYIGRAGSYTSFAKKITSMIEELEGVLLNPQEPVYNVDAS